MPKPKAILTKDERLLLALYEAAMEKGDKEAPVDLLAAAISVGLQRRGGETIAKLLFRSNFIKKKDDLVYLTPHGLKLVEVLLA